MRSGAGRGTVGGTARRDGGRIWRWGHAGWIGPPRHPAILWRTRRARLRVAALAVVVAGPVLAWVLASTLGGPPTARARPVERVVSDGAGRLVVEWAPEGCERVDPVSSDVVVDVRDVVVTVRALPADEDGACPVDTRTAWTVVLDDPLGDRTVRDGGCLAPGRRATEEQCADGAPTVPVVAPGSTG